MTGIAIAALIAAVAAVSTEVIEHRVRLDHHRGAIDARYRSNVVIAQRQVGAVTPGGRASSLRCIWSADISIDREARIGAGTMTRAITRRGAISGSRSGWCGAQRKAISDEVARREDEVRSHLLAAVQEDRADLLAEADRLHDGARNS